MPKLSLIIPAYNAEKSIESAINSVLCQEALEIELIVVDDGSKDNTLSICSKIEQTHPNMIVYHQENSGVSAARNKGLELATGEYIGFLDSDDLLAESYAEALNSILVASAPDLVLFGYSWVKQRKRIRGWIPQNTESVQEMFLNLLQNGGGLNSPCNKLFRRDTITDTFNLNKSMGEDLEFVCGYLQRVKTAAVIGQELYIYNIDTEGSLTKNLDIVLGSVVEDISVLDRFTKTVGVGGDTVIESLYQRVEGILGGIEEYDVYQSALEQLFSDSRFVELCAMNIPKIKKNCFLRNLLVGQKRKSLYCYLYVKRIARKVFK